MTTRPRIIARPAGAFGAADVFAAALAALPRPPFAPA